MEITFFSFAIRADLAIVKFKTGIPECSPELVNATIERSIIMEVDV